MPTYEYACTSCGHRMEKVQSFSEPSLTTCPACGAPLRKVFGNVGIVLKGSGFYKNDSRSQSNGAAKDSKPGAESKESKDSKDSKEPTKSTTSSDGGSKDPVPAKESAPASSGSDKAVASTP